MKVSKKKLYSINKYFNTINKHNLEDLDLSEFFVIDSAYHEAVKKFHFTGLMNEDFILSDFADRLNVQRTK